MSGRRLKKNIFRKIVVGLGFSNSLGVCNQQLAGGMFLKIGPDIADGNKCKRTPT